MSSGDAKAVCCGEITCAGAPMSMVAFKHDRIPVVLGVMSVATTFSTVRGLWVTDASHDIMIVPLPLVLI